MMPKLIDEWRELFDDEKLPFYYVQLCRLGHTVDENNPDTTSMGEVYIRQAQTDAYTEHLIFTEGMIIQTHKMTRIAATTFTPRKNVLSVKGLRILRSKIFTIKMSAW